MKAQCKRRNEETRDTKMKAEAEWERVQGKQGWREAKTETVEKQNETDRARKEKNTCNGQEVNMKEYFFNKDLLSRFDVRSPH